MRGSIARRISCKAGICLARFLMLISMSGWLCAQVAAQQVITTAASSGPNVIAMTSYQGNIYYATATPGAIYKMTPAGVVTLIAGAIGGGSTVNTIINHPPATSVSIAPGVNGLAFDAAGNLYFTEPANHQIREIVAPVDAPGAVVLTFDNSQLNYPGALVQSNGVLYVADESLQIVISENISSGIRNVIAGFWDTANPFPAGGYSGDGGPGNQAKLSHPRGLAFDAVGNLYIADAGNNAIRRVDTAGKITTVAGTGVAGFAGDGGAASTAQLFLPGGVAVDPSGNLLIADTSNNRIRVINTAGTISTLAGNGIAAFSGDGGAAANASLAFPTALTFDAAGNLYIADSQNNRIRALTGGNISTLAGSTQPKYAGDGAANGNYLNQPSYVAFDTAGNLFFSDTQNSRVRRLDAISHAISTVVGNGVPGSDGMSGPATNARIGCPEGLAFGNKGSLFIADPCAMLVFKVAPSTDGLVKGRSDEMISIFAGGGTFSPNSGQTSSATGITVGAVLAVAVEKDTDTVVIGSAPVEFNGGYVLAVSPVDGSFTIRQGQGTVVDSLAASTGDNTFFGSSDSDNDPITYASVALRGQTFLSWFDLGISSGNVSEFIGGLAFDKFGNLYASASETTDTVFEITSTQVLVLAGNRSQGYSGDGGDPKLAQLNQPFGVAVDPSGNVFIADTGNNVIREVGAPTTQSPPGVPALLSTPDNPTKQKSATFTFTDTDPTITSYSCVLDGVAQGCATGISYSNLADGSHTFGVSGQRADGTASASATFTWVVDTTPPPVPTIDSHPANPSLSANNNFGFSDAEAGVRFTCSLDGAATNCTSPVFYSNLADGPHTFSVSASDALQNQSAVNTFAWTIKTTPPPVPQITSSPAALSNQSAPSFSFSDGQAGVTFVCQVDAIQSAPCTSPAIYVGLLDGLHTFSVAASDATSGRSSAPATYTWTKDTTPPKVGIQGAPATVVIPNPSTVNFSGGSADIVGYRCSLDGAAYAACSSPFSQAIYTPGGHTFAVEAVDAAGNVSDPETTGWKVTYCHCDFVGDYSSPAFNDQISTTSQNFKVRVTYSGNGLDLADISVVDSGGAVLYTLPTTARGWQFSPDQTHLFYLSSLPFPNSPVEATVLDLSTSPAKRILTISNVGGTAQFSPSGTYLMVLGAPLISGNSSQYSVSVYRVGDVSKGVLVYSTTSFGATAGWGFSNGGNQAAESSFLFAFASGQDTVTWNVADLAAGRQTISQTSTLGNSFWLFNPCGNIIALVSNKPGSSEQVDLFSTETGTHLGGTSFPVQNVTISSSVDQAENPEEVAKIANPQQTIVIAQRKCDTNTPTGNNVSVAPVCSQSNSSPVTVTFSDVSQEGGTGVNESSTGNAPPGDFQIGNPPVYYDIASSATYSGDITICINYAGITFSGTPRLFHYENGAWVDRTTSVDTTTQTVCATVSSLSPFALFSQPALQAPAITSADRVTFQLGAPGGFTVVSSGSPTSALSESGALPNGIHFIDNGDGSAILTGTPIVGGTFILTLSASNTAGNATQNFVLTVNGATNHPPTANAGTNQIMEATSPAGAAATLSGSGSDPDNDSLAFTWSENGSNLGTGAQITVTLPVGVHTITLTADDGRGGTGTSTVQISVQDTKPPVFTAPANQTLEATSPMGAIATFSTTATDIVDGARPVICSPASGSTFPLGTTTVNCTSTDVHGNSSSASFTITVRDTTPPLVTPPASISIPATEAGGARGSAWPALAAFLAGATGKDNIDPSPVQLPPQFGNAGVNNNTLFPYGTTAVTFEFRDASGNVGSAAATVNVILGMPKISAQLVAQGKNTDGTFFLDVKFTNTGNGNARKTRAVVLTAVPTKGGGRITIVSPAFPMIIGIGSLDVGASQTVHVVLKVPSTVKQFAVAEGGEFLNVKGMLGLFAEAQSVTP